MHIEFFRVTFVYVITLSFIFCVYISYIDSRHVVSHHFCTSLPFLIYMLLTQDMNFTTILYIHVYNNVTNISAPRVLHFSAIHFLYELYSIPLLFLVLVLALTSALTLALTHNQCVFHRGPGAGGRAARGTHITLVVYYR